MVGDLSSPAFSDRTISELGSSPDGLTTAAATARLRRTGPNLATPAKSGSWWRLLARQFISPIELILVGATILSGVLGDWVDASIILTILLLSGILGFVQEFRADVAMRTLLASVEVTATVLRDRVPTQVRVSLVVPGDVAVLAAGDVIPGDGVLLSASGLTVDESLLTGEAFPVEKRPGTSPGDAPAAERFNACFMGTHVASGSGRLLVVRTGEATQAATIASALRRRPPRTGFEKGMTRFGLLLMEVMVVLVVVIFVANLLLQRPPIDSALFSLALAVGLTPQLLPAIVAIGLARGAREMARGKVVVRRLDAIEDVGAMTILCSDKTGTMTTGRVEFAGAFSLGDATNDEVLRLAALNAGLQLGRANAIDAAILAASRPEPEATALSELPYDFLRRRLSVLVRRRPDGDPLLITKGAFDDLLRVCSPAPAAEGAVPDTVGLDVARQRFEELSGKGYRVLGLATRTMPRAEQLRPDDETGLTLVGLLAFADPVKPDAAATIAALAANGVAVRMVTGDNAAIAARIASEVGLDPAKACTGQDVDAMPDAALAGAVANLEVFSEMDPVQKERVLRAYRRAGHVVGYLGDGINDAPALHAADVGVTVDTAVPVAKQAAAIVLLDKDLGVLLDGVREGRRTFVNTMKYVFVSTSASFGNMLSMAVAAAVLPFLPLLAGQILLINLLTDLPATAIATDGVDDDQLRRPQVWDVRLIRNFMIVFGALSSVFDLATFAVLEWGLGAGALEFRSAWFLGSIVTEVLVLFILRTRRPVWRSRPGLWIVVASAAILVVTIWIPYSPLAGPLQLAPIPADLLAIVIAIAIAYAVATEAVKLTFWRGRPVA